VGLFPKWRGTVFLPALPDRKKKIGQNWIYQEVFRGIVRKAELSDSQYKGHDELVLRDISAPFDRLLVRHKGARRLETSQPVVKIHGSADGDHLELRWEALGRLETYADTPEKVLASWTNAFAFREEDEDAGSAGLRRPQVGALHAISAHFAVGRTFDAATVVLPTGTGKTETMLAAQVYRRPARTLVLVPSDALRTQIARKFVSLGVLPTAEVVPEELPGPRVAVVSGGLKNLDEARELLNEANVIVTLPNTLRASNPDALVALTDGCSDLFVDEAHHVTAASWATIKSQFADKRIVQFTATPFRRDGKRVDGKIIFNYKLGDAQAAGYYRPIHLHTVEEYGDQHDRDRAIAIAALKALRDDLSAGYDHLIMARTETRERADEVGNIYRELGAEFHPVVVYSGTGQASANKKALDAIRSNASDKSRVVVCVDMLGEGFDLPNLKIAALHDAHKSLAITLQFIGRFTRKGASGTVGDATVVTNIADPVAEKKLSDLYAEGADWDQLIQRLSEERIETEVDLQEVVYALREKGDLHGLLSLWNLRPALSAQFYRTTCDEWNPEAFRSVLPKSAEAWFSLNEERALLVAVVSLERKVGWGDYDDLLDRTYDLLILKWDKSDGSLCLFASDYNGLNSEKMAQAVTDESTELVKGSPIFRILNNVELPLVKSLGSSRIGAISFTSYFGPNVTEGLALIEKAQSELNNVACLGYEDGERVLWGGTQRRGKVWQQRRGTITEWMDWAARTFSKISTESEDVANIIKDFLRPVLLTSPHESHPISVQWGEQAQMRFGDRQVLFGSREVPLFLIDLDIEAVADDGAIDFRLSTDGIHATYRLTISSSLPGGYRHDQISGPPVQFVRRGAGAVPIIDYFKIDPLIMRYADGTYSYNCYHIPARLSAGEYPVERLEVWDWKGIPLNRESMGKSRDADTIQFRAFEKINDDFELVFNDDGPGEAADLVALRNVDESTIRLCLVHCKNAHEGRISGDIRNFYTLCGQAQKSIAVKHSGMTALYLDLKRRQDLWGKQGYSRFLKGGMKELSFFKEKARRSKVEFEVIIAQPGASADSISHDARKLIATTDLFLRKTTEAIFRVAVSP
jgi:superfamily II DNA or RNA helicase